MLSLNVLMSASFLFYNVNAQLRFKTASPDSSSQTRSDIVSIMLPDAEVRDYEATVINAVSVLWASRPAFASSMSGLIRRSGRKSNNL